MSAIGGTTTTATVRDDAELVCAMAGGEAGALAELYDRHAPQMLALALKIVRIRANAEDMVHDVFLEAWEKAEHYDPARGSVVAWLAIRVRSRSLDLLRAADQSRVAIACDVFWSELAQAPSCDDALSPDRAVVRRALSDLAEPQREALFLGYFEGLSCSEIADRVGAPIGTVKSRVATALAKLRDALHAEAGAL